MTMYRRPITAVSLDVPRSLLRYAAGLGVDVADLAHLIDLEERDPQNRTGRLSIEKFDTLWGTIARRLNDPLLGLHCGEAMASFWGGHILFSVMVNCATLEEALEKFCRYHGLLVDGAAPQLGELGPHRIFALEQAARLGRQYAEAILAMLSVTIERLTENRIRPREVRFAHPPPTNVSEHQRIFGSALMFGQPDYGLVLDRKALDTPIFLADPTLLTYLEQFAQRALARLTAADAWTGRASETIGKLLLQGDKPRLSTVAGILAMSPRHLQNKLQSEGMTYQKLLDTIRQQIAQDCLRQDGMTICEVAFLLGFSEQSAFNRAFKHWTGLTPFEYSRRQGDVQAAQLIDPSLTDDRSKPDG